MTRELELPLGDAAGGALAHRRAAHLGDIPGVGDRELAILLRAYDSLAAIYAASEGDLAHLVGDVAAARIRWFLEAPLPSTSAALRAAS